VLLLRNTPWTRFLYADIRQMLDSQTTVSKVRPVPMLPTPACSYMCVWRLMDNWDALHGWACSGFGFWFVSCHASQRSICSALSMARECCSTKHRGLPCTMQMLETGAGPCCLVLTIPRTRGRR